MLLLAGPIPAVLARLLTQDPSHVLLAQVAKVEGEEPEAGVDDAVMSGGEMGTLVMSASAISAVGSDAVGRVDSLRSGWWGRLIGS